MGFDFLSPSELRFVFLPAAYRSPLSTVVGGVQLINIRRFGGVRVLGLRSWSSLTPDHCDSHVLLNVAGELVLGTVRRCGRSGVLAARIRDGFVADLELSHVRLFYIYGGRGLDFLLLFWARAIAVLSTLSTLRTLWSSVLVPASRCRLEAQPLSPHQLHITAR